MSPTYKVVPRGHGFWSHCVKAGDGDMELFSGHKKQCDRVAAALQTGCSRARRLPTTQHPEGIMSNQTEREALPYPGLGTTPDGQHPWIADQNAVAIGQRVWRNGIPHPHDLLRFSDALRDHFYALAAAPQVAQEPMVSAAELAYLREATQHWETEKVIRYGASQRRDSQNATRDAQGEGVGAEGTGATGGPGADEHHEHRIGTPAVDGEHDQRDSAGVGLSSEDQIRAPVAQVAQEPVAAKTIETWLPEARAQAGQCWCTPETSGIMMDARLAEAVAYKIAAWMDTGAFHARNENYWRERALKAESDASPQYPIAAPIAAPAQDALDAKRYRWLRNHGQPFVELQMQPNEDGNSYGSRLAQIPSALDAAVDSAMKNGEGGL